MIYLLTAFVFLTMLMILVAVHEWGHYLVAKACKMGISEFSIGFGPKVKTLRKVPFKLEDGEAGETEFNLRWIPLGGFVKVWGHEPLEDGSEVNIKGGFYSQTPIRRIAMLLAGPAFSIAFGIMVLTLVYTSIGVMQQVNVVKSLVDGKPAQLAGVKPGDRIVEIDGQKISNASNAMATIRSSTKDLTMKVERGAEQKTFIVKRVLSDTPLAIFDEDDIPTGEMKTVPMVGIGFSFERTKVGLGEAVVMACNTPIKVVRRLLSRVAAPRQLIEESTGVVGMAAMTKQIVDQQIIEVIQLSGMISISLGIMNLLPIGMLDGGQILIAFVELCRRGKRLSFQSQMSFLTAGLVFIVMMFVIVTAKDIRNLIFPEKAFGAMPQANKPATNPDTQSLEGKTENSPPK